MKRLEEYFAEQGKKKRRNLGDSMWPCYLCLIGLYVLLTVIEIIARS